jgi:uncharacterized membrane protein (UPF0127 family)
MVAMRSPFVSVVLLLAGLVAPARAAAPEMPLVLPSGKSLTVELMMTDEDRARGIMFRDSLPQDRGLLFVFPVAGNYPFWMKNCRFPIDMVFIGEDARVLYVAENVPPCRKDPCPTYGPSGPVKPTKYVLEINAGQAGRE